VFSPHEFSCFHSWFLDQL